MTNKSPAAKKLFEEVANWYDEVYKRFVNFRTSPPDKNHEALLGAFLYDANRQAFNLRSCLHTDDLPESGGANVRWKYYHDTLTNIGLMNLILELWGNEKGEMR